MPRPEDKPTVPTDGGRCSHAVMSEQIDCKSDGRTAELVRRPLANCVFGRLSVAALCWRSAFLATAATGQDPPRRKPSTQIQRPAAPGGASPARPPMIVLPGPFRLPGQVDDDAPNRPPLAVDRQTLRQLQTAADLIAKRNIRRQCANCSGFSTIRRIPGSSVPGGRDPRFQSAKQQAADRIGRLPASARESYETEYGQVARRMLEDATARGDRAALDEVVRRFFHTQAGYEAAYLLGNRLLDDSKLLAAAAQFDRLRLSPGGRRFEPMLSLKTAYCCMRSGLSEKALQILSSVEADAAGTSVKIGGRSRHHPRAGFESPAMAGSGDGTATARAALAGDRLAHGRRKPRSKRRRGRRSSFGGAGLDAIRDSRPAVSSARTASTTSRASCRRMNASSATTGS